MAEFRMPSLGSSMEAGTLVEWLKKPGDAVKRGDIIAVVDTEKGAIEIEVFEDGVLQDLRVTPGEKVPVGTVLAVIGGAASSAPAHPAPSAPAHPAPSAPSAPPHPAPSAPSAPSAPPPRSSPAARAAAKALGVDLGHLAGSGPGGAISLADVERAAAAARATPGAAAESSPPAPPALPDAAARMRQAIAAAMLRSKREIPHFYLATTIDMTHALAWLAAENVSRPVTMRLLPAVLLIKAVALALREVPEMSGFWIDGAAKPSGGIHPGVAVSLRGGGLVAPALHDADRQDLTSLMTALRDLVARARAGGLRSSELSDQTITITNLGDQGVEVSYGIIYPPQVALVSFGTIADRPLAVDGQVQVRPTVYLSVSVDHRAVDGHRAGRFLTAVDRLLQSPERL